MVDDMRPSILVAPGCTVLACALFTSSAVLLDVGTKGYAIVVPLVLWLMVLVPWLLRHDHWSPAQHQRGMYRALAAWAVTDLTVLFVFAT